MDKILKGFGIERTPLVDTTTLVQTRVVIEDYDIEPYYQRDYIDRFLLDHATPYHRERMIEHHIKNNRESLLNGIRPHIDTQLHETEHGQLMVESKINIGIKR